MKIENVINRIFTSIAKGVKGSSAVIAKLPF